ncbi:hypothetical protein RNJ44_03484 [Nakaseomyces bracarensis]|uniref:Serine/threonine-protein phosphatase n=1 Tax=Nakaseomyces bracarensis TaxID=273131 RepID=A0ABR4NX64_9SACH
MGNTGSKVKKKEKKFGEIRENRIISKHQQESKTDGLEDEKPVYEARPGHRKSHSVPSIIPPSMVQVEPHSPILMTPGHEKQKTKKTLLSHHRKSDTRLEVPPLSRSSSYTSSLHSRKSGGSGGTTAFTTPMNSPGVTSGDNGNPLVDDYFSHKPDNTFMENENIYNLNVPFLSSSSSSSSKDPNRMSSSTAVEDSFIEGENKHNSHFPHINLHNNQPNLHSSEKSTPRGEYLDVYPTISNETVIEDDDEKNEIMEETPTPCNEVNENGEQLVWINGRKRKMVDIDETIQKLLDAGYSGKKNKVFCLKNSEIVQICVQAREVFMSQPSLLELSSPVKIVGDVHGQFSDLLRLFTKCGFPPSSNYLFLGDYVDRGKQSLETILLLLCYKIKYPENFFLLRGNHECANVTRVYGFYDECKRRSSIKIWKTFIDTFNTLPLAAIVAGKIFCVHGGLSPTLNSMDEIRHVSRPTDVPDFGLINDLLWSDPTDSLNEWEDNERGVSYCYNKVAINKFLNKFGFDLICRAHMVVEDGYEFFNDRSLVTVFSAPNYCGEFDNWGAVMAVSDGLLCSFELLDPLDRSALKQVMKKGRQERKMALLKKQEE